MNLYCFSEPSLCGFYRTAACLVASNIPINSEEEPLDGNTKSNSPNLNISSQNDSGYSSLNLSGTTSLEGLVESDEIEITLESSLNLTQTSENNNQSTPKPRKKKQHFVSYEDGLESLRYLFNKHFSANEIQNKPFIKNINRLKLQLKKWSKDNSKSKNGYYSFFSPANWSKLSTQAKNKHSLICEECTLKHHEMQALFPSKSNRFANSAKKNLTNVLKKVKCPSNTVLKDCTNTIYNKVNTTFETLYGSTFADQLTKVSKLKLEKKITGEERRKKEIAAVSQVKETIQKNFDHTALDRYGIY